MILQWARGIHSDMTFSKNTILTKFSIVQEKTQGNTRGRVVTDGEEWHGIKIGV